MNTQSLISQPCAVCHRPTATWCSRCEKIWYCSFEHLQQDWQRHRKECIAVNASQSNIIATPAPVQPQLIKVNAIVFHPGEERYREVVVHCQPQGTHSQGITPMPLVRDLFTESDPSTIILTQGLNGEPLRFPLHIWYCPVSMQRGSPVNHAIFNLTSRAARKHWCGPVIVLKFNGSRRQGYCDAGTNDLTALSAYFLKYI